MKTKLKINIPGDTLLEIPKLQGMTAKDALAAANLEGFELLCEPDDFPIFPEEKLDFLEDGDVLYARPLGIPT